MSYFIPNKPIICFCIVLLLLALERSAYSQSIEDIIGYARTQSVPALKAKSMFVSDYWAWRSYQASRLPSLSLRGEIGNYNRYLNLLQKPETGEMVYASSYNLQNSVGLLARQNITASGGSLSLFSDLSRIDQFGINPGKTWYAQPITISYSQPLFSYNHFKWDKLISPKEYEKAKRLYLEAMEDVTIIAVSCYFNVLLSKHVYDASIDHFSNTTKMLGIARERLSLGTVTRDEYLQLELRHLNDSISINENLVLLREAQMQLNSLVGFDESHIIEPILNDYLPDVWMDYDFVLRKSSENSSFNLENSINILNAESAIDKAKADRGITMEISARFGLTNSNNSISQTYGSLLDQEIVGLSFSIPIFDWGLGKGKVKKAEAAADVIRAQVAQAENDKRISLFTAVGQFNNQRRQCDVSRRAADIAEERYSLVMEKFRNGKATVTELNTARDEDDEATKKYIMDISGFWTYYYTLRKLTLYDFIKGEDIDVKYDEMVN